MSSFVTVTAKLKTMLEELEGGGQPFVEIYDYPEPSPQQYPVAMIVNTGGSVENRLDTGNNILTMNFIIRIMVREKNTSAQEALIRSLVDSVLAKIRGGTYVDNLDNTVEIFDVDNVEFSFEEGEFPITVADIFVSAQSIKAIG